MAPVVRAIAASPELDQQMVLTGQHGGLTGFFDGLPPAAIYPLRFDPRGRSVARLRESLHSELCYHLRLERADLVLVHGDTASAVAGALAAWDCGRAIGHVEAGLRSFDLERPWPEEGNRVVIDFLADLLFAPTEAAARNLRAEWRVNGRVHVTGNTGIDQLFHARDRAEIRGGDDAPSERRLILATCHRKENQGAPMRSVCAALKRLTDTLPLDVALPLHPNRHLRSAMTELLAGQPHIRLLEPLEHGEMVRLMARSWLILTDSGGLQEEGAALGKPVLVLRDVTERPEGVETANLKLVGTDEATIVDAVAELLEAPDLYARMALPSLAFGDGKAAPRIVAAIERWLRAPAFSRMRASAGRAAAPSPRARPPAARSERPSPGSGR